MKKRIYNLFYCLIVILIISIFGYFFNNNTSYAYKEYSSLLTVNYIDVGQGDSIFIELPNNETMLIDAGEVGQGELVNSYISEMGYTKINYVVGSHPHSDHIGGLSDVINNFDVKNIYMPKITTNTSVYKNLLNTISKNNLTIKVAKAGVNIVFTDDLKVSIIAPKSEKYSNLNDYSAVIKITYGNTSFLFMGDAQKESEDEILNDISNIDVVKIGHHGSDTSSSKAFVDKINAKYGIISVGKNNIYFLPSNNIINRWENSGTKIYRTDKNGTIKVTSDGNNIVVK